MPVAALRPRHPGLALLGLLPVPALGAAAALWWWPGTPGGKALFFAAKLWLVGFPLYWHLRIDRARLRWQAGGPAGRRMGWASGLVFAALILAAYRWTPPWLMDFRASSAILRAAGLDAWPVIAGMGLYWSTVNALIEEAVWRGFVLRQARAITGHDGAAIAVAAAGFTLHHAVAISAWLPPAATAAASAAIAFAGAFWGWMARRYGSIGPGLISHVIADVAVFAAAAHGLLAAP